MEGADDAALQKPPVAVYGPGVDVTADPFFRGVVYALVVVILNAPGGGEVQRAFVGVDRGGTN
jgi:hypothetical protein